MSVVTSEHHLIGNVSRDFIPGPLLKQAGRCVLTAVLWLSVSTDLNATAQEAPPESQQLEFFESKIRPILAEHCYECHSSAAKSIKGGLQVDSRQGLLMGGDSGPAIVPGDSDGSLLMQAMRHESFEMPPDQKLPEQVLSDFRAWIDSGAADPRDGKPVTPKQVMNLEEGRKFWSFQPVTKPNVPDVNEAWVQSDIDRYIAAHQQQHNVTVAAPATPDVMIRRLHFVLTGLPPAPSQIDAFEEQWQQSPDKAIENTVDRLLESRHFGERWGRHWLDVTRFAESSGGGRSLMFPHAWRFRDYIIDSFNHDKPYNQLVREHLAGDKLPFESDEHHDQQIIGSGYLILGAINYEEQDKEALRMDVVDEQIESLGRTFLGMTLGCARCHDHKFDPIPTNDYYALAGILRSTKVLTPGNVSGYVMAPLRTGYDKSVMQKWQAEHDELSRQIASLQKQLSGPPIGGPVTPSQLPGIVVDDSDAVLTGEWMSSTFVPNHVNVGYKHSGQPKTGTIARFSAMVPAEGEYSVRIAYNGAESRSKRVPVRISQGNETTSLSINQSVPPVIDGLWTELGRFQLTTVEPVTIEIDAAGADPGYVIIDAVQLLPVALLNQSDPQVAAADSLKQREKQLTEMLKQHDRLKPEVHVAMSVQDEAEPSDWHVHIRGGIRNLGPVVPRGVLRVTLPTEQWQFSIPPKESGRLQLANWVASTENPLTARVFVNRVWTHVIGEGIVRTPDNFGTTGQLPTHPELLDYLAWTFMHEDHWSTKSLIRRICLSGTFRISSAPSSDMATQDPDNLLLTRGFRRRLEAESIRDAMLTVSGSLDLKITGGRTIGKITEYDNVYDHTIYPTNARSIYVPFFRNAMLNLFDVFDIANPNMVTGKRTTSTLPSQSLFLMNSPFVLEQAELAASHFLAQTNVQQEHLDDAISHAWLMTCGRRPTTSELLETRDYLSHHGSTNVSAWADVFHSLFTSIDFRFVE
ncbi:MAG: DUF1553 domain-containing protein [Planctomyces sp.]|nr:DUF1553 domain-containing protein [Planctomyces sp.]